MFSSDNIANDVEVKIILSSPFKFSTENEKDITIIEGGATSIVKKLGNITAAYNEFKIEVESLSDTKLLEMVDLALYENELFPYQILIDYTALNGNKQRRVITDKL